MKLIEKALTVLKAKYAKKEGKVVILILKATASTKGLKSWRVVSGGRKR